MDTTAEILDQVKGSNPLRDKLVFLKKGPYEDIYLAIRNEAKSFPPNSSRITRDEVRMLIDFQNSKENQNKEITSRFLLYDSKLLVVFQEYVREKIGQNMDDVLADLEKDLSYPIYKLKYHFQRPRPAQIACMPSYRAMLFPYNSSSGTTPSYPSAHVFTARVFTELIGSRYPEHYKILMEMTMDISTSRLMLGLSYPSDNDFAIRCATLLISSKEFTQKYEL